VRAVFRRAEAGLGPADFEIALATALVDQAKVASMRELLFFVASSFWAGAAHAATPGHGKTIAAAYIVGARGKPIDAVILGIFVTLSHTSGIVLVGVLASLGSTWLRPQRIEAYLAVAVGILVILLGLWMLWSQRSLVALATGEAGAPGDGGSRTDAPARDHHHHHAHHHHAHDHPHAHEHGAPVVWHSHGFGKVHAHRLDVVAENRPKLPVLLALGIAGGLLPDPAALALLLGALSSGKVLLGLATVLVFGLGFAATLTAVGIIAAKIGEKVLDWLASIWMIRLQIATGLLIVGMGVVLTIRAMSELAALPAG
jgi:nickel/cobalt exporter